MAKFCDICGKGPSSGSTYTRKGVAKKKGGVGIKIVRVNLRRFLPNLRKVRVFYQGAVRRLNVCTRCLKSGTVEKPKILQNQLQ